MKYYNNHSFDGTREIAAGSELKKVEEEQRRLADLYVKGSLPQDILDTKSKDLREKRQCLEAEVQELNESRPVGLDINKLSLSIPVVTEKIKKWVLEASKDEMDLILRALDIQISASREEVQIKGIVPASVSEAEDLVTIAQTSALPRGCTRLSRRV